LNYARLWGNFCAQFCAASTIAAPAQAPANVRRRTGARRSRRGCAAWSRRERRRRNSPSVRRDTCNTTPPARRP